MVSMNGYARSSLMVFEAVDVPCLGPLYCSRVADYVGSSLLVCVVEDTYFHFGMCGCQFVPYPCGECPGLCLHHMSHLAYTGVVHLSVQVDGKVLLKRFRR